MDYGESLSVGVEDLRELFEDCILNSIRGRLRCIICQGWSPVKIVSRERFVKGGTRAALRLRVATVLTSTKTILIIDLAHAPPYV
jgi:hypothetical protein